MNQQIAEFFKTLRAELKFDQLLMAKALDISKSTVSRIERGAYDPTFRTFQKALGLMPSQSPDLESLLCQALKRNQVVIQESEAANGPAL